MELGPYVNDLQRQLVDAADNGTQDTRAVAERLAAGLDAAARLVLLDVLSAAAGEITRDLAPGSVDVRLRGREIEFVVTQPSSEADSRRHAGRDRVDADDASTSRTTLRLPDALKARVDEAAAADGLSVNTWLVRAIAAASNPSNDDRSSARCAPATTSPAGRASPLAPASPPPHPRSDTKKASACPLINTPTPIDLAINLQVGAIEVIASDRQTRS